MTLDDIISLAEAADELGLGASTLRHQAQDGRLAARVVGKTWITTRQEVERYRRENLGQVGRPAGSIRSLAEPIRSVEPIRSFAEPMRPTVEPIRPFTDVVEQSRPRHKKWSEIKRQKGVPEGE